MPSSNEFRIAHSVIAIIIRADENGRTIQEFGPYAAGLVVGAIVTMGVNAFCKSGQPSHIPWRYTVDIDGDDLGLVVALMNRGRHYGLPLYVERSKSKGHHLWLLFHRPVAAFKARSVLSLLLDDVEAGSVEVFPKQDRIDVARGEFDNFINAPLFGRLVPRERTVFLDPA